MPIVHPPQHRVVGTIDREPKLNKILLASGGFTPPSLDDFFPKAIFFKDSAWFSIDRLTLVRLLLTAVLLVFFVLAARKPTLVPSGLQSLGEIVIDFIRVNIAEEILGKKNARTYLPLLSTIFLLVLFGNISSVIPLLNISPNGRIAMPLVLALLGYVTFIAVGVKRHGLKYFYDAVVIKGVPPVMHLILVPIEILSTFVLRPFTLTIRLMANMLSGHIMLALFYAATQFFFLQSNVGWMKPIGIGSIAGAIAFTFFEILVALLQAYIFALLVAVYIDSSIHVDAH